MGLHKNAVIEDVCEELRHATQKFPSMKSAHEGYAVLLEEVDELWHEIKHGTRGRAEKEAIQVAAMALRLIQDIYRHDH